MLQEATELIGRQCYTDSGIYLGSVSNVVIDVNEAKINGLYVADTNPLIVDNSRAVLFPYRWIRSVGDVILLKYFPKKISSKERATN